MYNLKINSNCKTDLLLGIQLEKQHCEYKLGYSLEAAIDKGNIKEKQEDAVIILEHPKDSSIKLLAVADGVSSNGNSEQASRYVLEDMTYLFETNNYITKNDSIYNINVFKSRLEKINQEIIRKNMGSATLSMALYNPKETIIFNAGDSRIYTYKNKTLNQETKDDSYVQCLYDQKIVKNKELMRFHKKSNLITNALGTDKFHVNIDIISSNYDILLALTDGVTDSLSESEIKSIIKNCKNYNLAEILIEIAKKTTSYNSINDNGMYYRKLNGGEDNLSVAVLKRK